MEDLIGLLVTIGVILVWVVQNVFTGKRQAQQEFEEALQELDDEEEFEVLVEREPSAPPARPRGQAPSTPPAREVPKGAPTWEDLQRQLQELIGAPTKPAPESRPPQAEAPGQPPGRTAPDFPPLPPRERPAPFPIPRPMERRPAPSPRPVPQPISQPARVSRPEPALQPKPRAESPPAVRRMAASSAHRPAHPGKFPNLLPNPLANAVLMGEILRPYSRRRRWGAY